MKIVFVQNFLLDSSGLPCDDILYPHLGLISLIAEIEHSRHVPLLYDPMLQLQRGHLALDSSIYDVVAEQLLQTEPAAVGLTALGCNCCENRPAVKTAQAGNACFVRWPTSHSARVANHE